MEERDHRYKTGMGDFDRLKKNGRGPVFSTRHGRVCSKSYKAILCFVIISAQNLEWSCSSACDRGSRLTKCSALSNFCISRSPYSFFVEVFGEPGVTSKYTIRETMVSPRSEIKHLSNKNHIVGGLRAPQHQVHFRDSMCGRDPRYSRMHLARWHQRVHTWQYKLYSDADDIVYSFYILSGSVRPLPSSRLLVETSSRLPLAP